MSFSRRNIAAFFVKMASGGSPWIKTRVVAKPTGKKLSQQSDTPNNTCRRKLSRCSRVFTATSMSLRRRCTTWQCSPWAIPHWRCQDRRSRWSAKPFPRESFTAARVSKQQVSRLSARHELPHAVINKYIVCIPPCVIEDVREIVLIIRVHTDAEYESWFQGLAIHLQTRSLREVGASWKHVKCLDWSFYQKF